MAELPSSPGLAAIRETAAYKLLCWRRAGAEVLVNELGLGPMVAARSTAAFRVMPY